MFDRMKLNCLSAWFPAVKAAGLPVPKTEIVTMSPGWNWGDLLDYADAGNPPPWFHSFLGHCAGACVALQADGCGWPLFLRTGQTSGKHDWTNTARLPSIDALPKHVAALVMYSTMVSMLGLPCDVWVFREMLPVKPVCTLPKFGDMPLVPEVRGFVRGGKVECIHPYWPDAAIEQGFGKDYCKQMPKAVSAAAAYAQVVPTTDVLEVWSLLDGAASALKDLGDGCWSVDLLMTDRGWVLTDCALGVDSYHLPGCPRDREQQSAEEPAKPLSPLVPVPLDELVKS